MLQQHRHMFGTQPHMHTAQGCEATSASDLSVLQSHTTSWAAEQSLRV